MALTEVQILFRQSLHQRINTDEFCELLKTFRSTRNVKNTDIVVTYLNCCLNFCVESDPRLTGYLQAIITTELTSVLDLVIALLLQWNKAKDSSDQKFLQKLVSCQTRIVTDFSIILATTNNRPSDATVRKCIILSSRWLATLAKWALKEQGKEHSAKANNLTESVGALLVSFLNIDSGSDGIYPAVQQALDQCMGAFPSVSMSLMNKINTMPRPDVDEPADAVDLHVMDMAAFQFESGIRNPPIIASRNSTVVLLRRLLEHRSTIDDSVIYSFLNSRHAGNHAMMFNELVVAAVDAATKPPFHELYQSQCQLFFLNKLPFILAFIVTSSFEGSTSEEGLTEAWNYLNASAHDFIPTGRRFLQICSSHHLIPAESVSNLIGEETSGKGLYAKDDLVAQVTANHARGPRLVDELLKNDGNAGSISQAIYEIMSNYCDMRETQHLKEMANIIVRKPLAINAIGMFIQPSVFLTSFCVLLDNWKWDDIHGESQPVYDEFGSVLLLILAFKQRLNLTNSGLGIQRKDGFVSRYLSSANTELKETSVVVKQIGDWIKSLYIDEGLSDELTTNCSAQDFYMLVPSLLRQSVMAHSRGKLSGDMLKAGLEYLLEPFLLPSLLPAFGWIERIADREPENARLVVQILIKSPGSLEAREVHQTILAIAADNLETKNSMKGLLESTTHSTHKMRFGIKKQNAEGVESLTRTIGTTDYDPATLASVIQACGPLRTVQILVSLLLQFSGSHEFHTLLDFVATICADTLLNAVRVSHSKVAQYLKKNNNLYAEAVIHLYRRVELYAETLTPQDLGLGQNFVSNLNVANINLDTGPETFQQPEQQNEDIDQVLNEAAVMDSLNQIDNTNLDDMYLQGNDFGLGSLDDLDLDMF